MTRHFGEQATCPRTPHHPHGPTPPPHPGYTHALHTHHTCTSEHTRCTPHTSTTSPAHLPTTPVHTCPTHLLLFSRQPCNKINNALSSIKATSKHNLSHTPHTHTGFAVPLPEPGGPGRGSNHPCRARRELLTWEGGDIQHCLAATPPAALAAVAFNDLSEPGLHHQTLFSQEGREETTRCRWASSPLGDTALLLEHDPFCDSVTLQPSPVNPTPSGASRPRVFHVPMPAADPACWWLTWACPTHLMVAGGTPSVPVGVPSLDIPRR